MYALQRYGTSLSFPTKNSHLENTMSPHLLWNSWITIIILALKFIGKTLNFGAFFS